MEGPLVFRIVVSSIVRIFQGNVNCYLGKVYPSVTVYEMVPRGVFVCNIHENPRQPRAKMSALCSFCVHYVTVNGKAMNSNVLHSSMISFTEIFPIRLLYLYIISS